MSKANASEIEALRPFLEDRVAQLGSIAHIKKFGSGQSNPTYMLETSTGKFVLRTQPPGKLLKSAHRVDREFRVMQALAETEVPVPPVLFLADEDNPLGRMFYLMGHVEGRIFWDPALPEAHDNDERAAIFDAMNATLAALHNVNVKAAGLEDYGRPGDYFARQYARWSEQYRATETREIANMDRLIAWLGENMPPDDGQSCLVHGDFRHDNMIFAPKRPAVLALIDWELSTLGHPLADLSYQCMQWRLPHASAFKGLGGIDRTRLGVPTEEAYVERYAKRRGLSDIPHWNFYLAFAFFRLAAICQGVYKRALDGNASNPQKAEAYGQQVETMADLAMDLVQSA